MLKMQYQLLNLLNSNGEVENQIKANEQEELALEIMKHHLGCTITINNKKFILSQLELYYGGIGDLAHDWYRAQYPEKYVSKPKNSKECAKFFMQEGPIVYLNHQKVYQRTRFDIIIGNKGVPVSFLVRNIMDENEITISLKDVGSTSEVVKALGLSSDLIGVKIDVFDTHLKYFKESNFKKNLRVNGGKFIGFSKYKDSKIWNYSIGLKK